MEPIKFKHQNTVVAKNQEEYNNLPALMLDTEEKHMITCNGLSLKERLKVLFTGKIWLVELTFGKDITPRYFCTRRKDAYTLPTDGLSFFDKVSKKLKALKLWMNT